MSWSSAKPGGSVRLSRRAMLALGLLPLAGCGFHPLYAKSQEAEYEPELAAIKVAPIADRIGQQLELSLREAFNPRGVDVEPRYTLNITLILSRIDLGIQRDASATRGRVDVTAAIILADSSTAKILYQSRTKSTSSFNVVDDAYASHIAEDDARTRTVRDLTDEIRTRLAFYLRQRHAAN